jgi:gliding motility-associated-like protein
MCLSSLFRKGCNAILLVVIFHFTSFTKSYSQDFSTKGVDFWFGFMQNYTGQSGFLLDVYISSEFSTNGIIDIPLAGWSSSFSVVPGIATKVTIPTTYMASGSEVIEQKGIHLVSDDTVSVFAMNYRSASFDASMIMPIGSIGDEYMILAYEGYSTSSYPSEFLIVATTDNTVVEITPAVKTSGGKSAGVPFTVTINQGETYPVQASSNGDLSGSTIKSYNGIPIAVYGGVACAKINGCTYCDHIFEQLYPMDTWGHHYILVPLKSRTEDTYRVIAKENGTTVIINGSTVTLNAGQYYEFDIQQSVSTLDASCPVSVAQYCQGYSCDNVAGDPFILMISPNEQMVTEATFEEISTSNITDFYINVVVKTNNISNVTLDGNNISSSFSTVSGDPNYSYAQLTTTSGTHTLKADSGFLAYVYGLGYVESYGYTAGASYKNLTAFEVVLNNDTIDYALFNDTICPGETLDFQGYSNLNILSWVWHFGDGDSATGQSSSHTYSQEGAFDAYVIIEKNSGCTIEKDTLFTKIVVKGISFTMDGENEECGLANGMAYISYSDTSAKPSVSWNTPLMETTDTIKNLSAGQYIVIVSYGDCIVSDSIIITNESNFSFSTSSFTDSCDQSKGMAYASVNGNPNDFSYSWNTNPVQTNDTAFGLSQGTYIITLTNDSGCKATDTVFVDNLGLDVSLSGTDENCDYKDGAASVYASSGSGNYSYGWNTNPVQNTSSISGLNAGVYIVTVTDGICTVTDSVVINGPTIFAPNFVYTELGNSAGNTMVNFQNLTSSADSVFWSFGDGSTSSENNPTHTYTDTGTYQIMYISYQNGCVDTLIQFIQIRPELSLVMPNIFTPDADGFNDYFIGITSGVDEYEIFIYNRWGKKVYYSDDIAKPWDGKSMNNQKMPDGVYYYVINAKDYSENISTYNGYVQLIR